VFFDNDPTPMTSETSLAYILLRNDYTDHLTNYHV